MKNRVQQVRDIMDASPKIKAAQVAAKLRVTTSYAYLLMSKAKRNDEVHKTRMQASTPRGEILEEPVLQAVSEIQTIDFIEEKNLSYNLGNAVMYITEREGRKLEDLRKAQWYLTREIAILK